MDQTVRSCGLCPSQRNRKRKLRHRHVDSRYHIGQHGWDSLLPNIQCDYACVKEKLQEVFGQKQFRFYFQTCISARPSQPKESLEVYAADISRLVAEVFPDYDRTARAGENYRHFPAGLGPALQAKCHEHAATNMEEALRRCERARQALRAHTPGLPYLAQILHSRTLCPRCCQVLWRRSSLRL